MKGNPQVLKRLNLALKGELTAINQYFLHARMLDDWGVTKMGKHEYKESIEEMQHADLIIKRILLLGGLPNLQDLGKLYIGENVKEVIECDLKLEREGIENYRAGIKDCEEANDYVTRDLFIKILTDEEGHEDFLETQLKLIEQMGVENYIQLNADATPEQDA
ncbi:MAG: bacterioferritin [Micavibrio aeruginosavorus]|uniref:Bacterioferritin n=1 Tax=Micavibrio aeruginosavorus TaxID=349221 RepID=A0A2W5A0K5_9BACT|nr:MAG: bacterioferritin [Micavibrio aeruginosavorus]